MICDSIVSTLFNQDLLEYISSNDFSQHAGVTGSAAAATFTWATMAIGTRQPTVWELALLVWLVVLL